MLCRKQRQIHSAIFAMYTSFVTIRLRSTDMLQKFPSGFSVTFDYNLVIKHFEKYFLDEQ